MATLAESFLADLDDLSDGDGDGNAAALAAPAAGAEGIHVGLAAATGDSTAEDLERLRHAKLEDVAKLAASDDYRQVVSRVRDALANPERVPSSSAAWRGPSDEDPTYALLLRCNETAVAIEDEVTVVFNFLRKKYASRFPELESLVSYPVDYASVVKAIGGASDLTAVNLEGVLPSATIMVVSVTASTTQGRPFQSEEELAVVTEASSMLIQLEDDRTAILNFVADRLASIAPNLSAIVSTSIAAKLIGIAGGLPALAKIPAGNMQLLGAKKDGRSGLSTRGGDVHFGFIASADVIQQTPPALRTKAVRLLSGKCALLARVDAFGQDPEGEAGAKMGQEIKQKIEKWMEPGPGRIVKPLPVPDAAPKKRRGGRRLRKRKERYGMTEMRRKQNRVSFNVAEEELMDGEDTLGLGQIGQVGLRQTMSQASAIKRPSSSAKTPAPRARDAVNGLISVGAALPDSSRKGTASVYFS